MRNLNKKQKKVLTSLAKDYYNKINWYMDINDLLEEDYIDIVEMNDHETIYQNIERYLYDIREEL